jgi:uncharacterized protein (DUF2126 family)
MKHFKLLSLIGITSIALAHAGWAGGHGGGGFGGGHGGGGFGGGYGGGGHGGGGFGGGHSAGSRGGGDGFGEARTSSGVSHFNGGGAAPSSFGTRPSDRQPVDSRPANRLVTPAGRATTTAFDRQQDRFASPGNRAAQVSRSAVATPSDQGTLSARDHVFGRHDRNWHRDWDQRHAHLRNGHWWFFDGGTWVGLDAGYYPWDYYPYSAYDYYPYDYSPGYYSGVESASSNDGSANQQANPTVSAVQSRLAILGYYHGVVDAVFGPDTRTALTRYQIDNRLSVTASLTTETLQSLGLQKIATS